MGYDLNNQNNYDHMKGAEHRSHEGSQSHTGSAGTPSKHNSISGAGTVGETSNLVSNPGGYTQTMIGSGGSHNEGM